jgi:hypothetical protein
MPHTNAFLYDIRNLLQRSRENSYATRGDRADILELCARQLRELGFKEVRVRTFGLRHVNRLVKLWISQNLSTGTIYNRLAACRWLAEKANRGHVLPPRNDFWDLEPRHTVATVSKAQVITEAQIAQIPDPWVQWSVRLQVAYGLRREEALKIRPWQADQGDHVALQASWCKGGRAREIPITKPEQRQLLDALKMWVPTKRSSLIPAHLTYIEQRRRYDRLTREVGLHHLHGARHAFAQSRLAEETGYDAPVAGGPSRRTMTREERARDTEARRVVSRELGHGRYQIIGNYCGT